jgi:hypothetical protein
MTIYSLDLGGISAKIFVQGSFRAIFQVLEYKQSQTSLLVDHSLEALMISGVEEKSLTQ